MERLRDLAAGVICTGFEGNALQDAIERSRDFRFGGYVVFSRNADSVEGVRIITDALRRSYAAPPILAIDQEGGRVARIRRQAAQIPPAMTIGATGQPELSRRAGAQVGHDLRRAGINVDFAPVLDLALHAASTVIGTRAFSDDARVVARFGRAFADGLRRAGIVPTFKHFPGHGSTAVDSHCALPVVEADENTLRSRDLIPFETLLSDAQAVMTAHVVFNAFDSRRPATFAPALLTGVLRNELHFNGVCFTDCMQMDAIAKTVGSEEGSVLALEAGADCILISNGLELACKIALAIEQAVASERLPFDRLREAHARVRALRARLSQPVPLGAKPPDPDIGSEIERASSAA